MGKWQAYVQVLHKVGGGGGFSVHVPRDERRTFDTACLEGQLWLVRLLSSKNIRSVDDFVRVAAAHAAEVVRRSGARCLVVCFDDPRRVSKAKAATQQERDESAQKSVDAKSLKAYTDEECAQFFVHANPMDASGAVRAPSATNAALMPTFDRLRVSRLGSEVQTRAKQFLIDAIRAAPFEKRDGMKLIFVFDSTVEHGRLCAANNGTDDYVWQGLDLDGTPAPATLAEAEELVAHYALLPRTGKRVYVRCSDTDIVAILAHGVQREQVLPAPSRKTTLWLDLYSDADLSKSLPTDEEQAAAEAAAEAAAAAAAAHGKQKRASAAANDYPRCVDMVLAVNAFFDGARTHPSFSLFTHPLHVLTYVACLGGSDFVKPLRLMTCDAWIKALESDKDVATWLSRSLVCVEKPKSIDAYQVLRSLVFEGNSMLEFVALQFAQKMTGKKYQAVSKARAFFPDTEEALAQRFADMAREATELRDKREADAKADYEKKLAAYEEALAAERQRVAEANKQNESAGGDGTVIVAAAASSSLKKPTLPEKRVFVPLDIAEVRARLRRAHWNLQKVINGTVPGGVRPFDEQRDGASVWGWDEKGECTLNIVPYTKELQLFAK